MTKYYVTFKEYNKSPRYIIVKFYRGVLANLATIKNGLIDKNLGLEMFLLSL